MYGREYDGRVLSFEASGALQEASLVMRDRETDSWWSIISGDAIGGALEGVALVELPVGEKVTWGEWRRRQPQTLVLSVDGVEHEGENPYDGYFASRATFRGIGARDLRLPARESIYSFRLAGQPYAVPHTAIDGGAVFDVDGGQVFLYRRPDAPMFESTRAYFVPRGAHTAAGRIRETDRGWVDSATGAVFDGVSGFVDAPGPESAGEADPQASGEYAAAGPPIRLTGFDTFWYMWSNINENTILLGQS